MDSKNQGEYFDINGNDAKPIFAQIIAKIWAQVDA